MFSAALNEKLQQEAKKREKKQKIESQLKVLRSELRERYEQRMDMLLLKCLSNPQPQDEEFIFAEKFNVYKNPPKYKVEKEKFIGSPRMKLTDNSNEQNRRKAELEKSKIYDTDLAPLQQFIFRRRLKEREIQPRMVFEPTKKIDGSPLPEDSRLNRPDISSKNKSKMTSLKNDRSVNSSINESFDINMVSSNRPVLPPFKKSSRYSKSTLDDSMFADGTKHHLPYKSIKHYLANPNSIDLTQRYGNYTKVLEAYDTIRYEARTRTKVKHPSATIDINREVPQDTVDTDGYCIDDSMLWGEEFVKEINSGNYDTLRKRKERDSYRESVAKEILKSQTRSANTSVDYR